MPTTAVSASVDTRPLTEPVDMDAARARVKELVASGEVARFAPDRVAEVLLALMGAAFVAAGIALSLPLLAVFGCLWVGLVIGGAFVARRIHARQISHVYRFDRFAAANGFVWRSQVYDPRMPGMLFPFGSLGRAHDHIRIDYPRRIEVANYERLTGSTGLRESGSWGYAAVKLPRPLPHIVLDAVGNNSLLAANLPATFTRDQRLSLEGDFDSSFRLYCPAGYERDALYLFTPDIMARFIDNAAALDVEIVDDWLFLYSTRELSTLDPQTWEWLLAAIDGVLEKVAQWERWRDDRLAAPAPASRSAVREDDRRPAAPPVLTTRPRTGVAKPGQRLRTRVSWASIGFAAVPAVAIAWAAGLFDHLGELLR